MEIHIQIQLDRDGWPSREDLFLRYEIEDTLMEQGVGKVVDAGGGGGVMDIYLVPERPDALSCVEQTLEKMLLRSRARVCCIGEV